MGRMGVAAITTRSSHKIWWYDLSHKLVYILWPPWVRLGVAEGHVKLWRVSGHMSHIQASFGHISLRCDLSIPSSLKISGFLLETSSVDQIRPKEIFTVVKRVIIFLTVEAELLALTVVDWRFLSHSLWGKLDAHFLLIPLVYTCTKDAKLSTRALSFRSTGFRPSLSAFLLLCGYFKFRHVRSSCKHLYCLCKTREGGKTFLTVCLFVLPHLLFLFILCPSR